MGTFEQKFCPERSGFWVTLRRNIGLLAYLARLAWGWLVVGGRTRRALRAKQAANDIYWLDQKDQGLSKRDLT